MSIRRKFFKYILPPSVFGILLTTILAIYFLLIFYFNLLKNTKENVLSEEYTSMKSISDSLAMSMQEYFISKASYLEECINFSESLMITSKPSNFGIQNITALNAYDISVGEHDDEFVNLPYEINKKYSMWYLNTITDVSLLSEKSLERLLFASQLELEMKSIYEGSEGISAIFVLFMDDGLQFEYPSFKTDRYSNYSLKNDECPVSLKIENYDLRCSRQIQFGLNFLKNISVNTTQFLSEPFMIMEHKKFGITLCCIHYKNTTSSNFSNIPKSERVIDYLICAEFSFIDMENVNKAFIEHNGYHYVLDKFNHLIFHPKLRKNYNFTVHEYVQSITHYEFDMPDNFLDPLALEYNKTILPLIQATFTQNEDITSYENQIIKLVYNKKDGEYFGTISPLFFPITGSSDYYHLANLVFIEKSDVVVQVNKF